MEQDRKACETQAKRQASFNFRVGVADSSQRLAIAALRRAAYRGAAQFEWKDESTLDWSAADDTGTVMAVWDAQGALLSTIRASVFCGADTAEAFLYARMRLPVFRAPVGLGQRSRRAHADVARRAAARAV